MDKIQTLNNAVITYSFIMSLRNYQTSYTSENPEFNEKMKEFSKTLYKEYFDLLDKSKI